MLQQDGARLVGPQVKYHVRLVLENKKYFSIEKFLILTVHIRTTFQDSPNLTSPVSSLVEQNQNQTKIHQSSLRYCSINIYITSAQVFVVVPGGSYFIQK